MATPHLQLSPEEPEDERREARMGFLEHLDELRTRLIRACLAVAAGMAIAFFFVDRISNFVLEPTLRMLPPGSQLVFIRPGENFSFYFDIALIGGRRPRRAVRAVSRSGASSRPGSTRRRRSSSFLFMVVRHDRYARRRAVQSPPVCIRR